MAGKLEFNHRKIQYKNPLIGRSISWENPQDKLPNKGEKIVFLAVKILRLEHPICGVFDGKHFQSIHYTLSVDAVEKWGYLYGLPQNIHVD